MGDLIDLCLEGCVEFGMAVTVDVDPERRDAVEVAFSRGIKQIYTFAAFDDDRVLRAVVGHLGEGMPNEFFV